MMRVNGYSAVVNPSYSTLSAAYAFGFIATLASLLYTGLKIVEYRELGGKVSIQEIRNMLPSNRGGYKRTK
jgi:hypothetical protein